MKNASLTLGAPLPDPDFKLQTIIKPQHQILDKILSNFINNLVKIDFTALSHPEPIIAPKLGNLAENRANLKP